MAKSAFMDGFLLPDPIKPWRWITWPVKPVNDINMVSNCWSAANNCPCLSIVSVSVNYWRHSTAACVLMFYTWVCVCLWILNVYKWTFSMNVITYVLGLSRPEMAMVFHCFARGVNSTASHWCIARNHNINLCLRQLSLVAAALRSYSYNLISSRVC